MTGLSVHGRLEKISEALVLADIADFAGLAKLHTQFEELVECAIDSRLDPKAIDVARHAATLIEAIVLEESKTPQANFDQVVKAVTHLQQIISNPPAPTAPAPDHPSASPAPAIELPSNVDEKILTDFLARQGSVMEQLEEWVMSLEHGDDAGGDLPRLLHTLKGEAALLGLEEIEQVCHAAEDYLGSVPASSAVDLLLEVKDWLSRKLEAYGGRGESPGTAGPLVSRLNAGSAGTGSASLGLLSTADSMDEAHGDVEPAAAGSEPFTIDDSLAPDFCSEASEHLDASDHHLLTLESNPGSADAVNAVFRAFHTLKGGAGMIGAKDIGAIAHEAENLLDKTRKGQLQLSGPSMDVTFETVDTLKRMVGSLRTYLANGAVPRREPNHDSLIRRLRQAAAGETVEAAPSRRSGPAADPVLHTPKASGTQPAVVQVKETVKVDADRLDRLVDMIGELVIAESMVSQSPEIAALNSLSLARQVGQLDKITRELQEMATSLRMVPLRSTFQKMARLVRDLARKTGKNVDFVTAGEETELDKTVVDGISDPLVHMVRNAVDHGIETDPADRARLGKSSSARVELRAFHKGGNIYIQLEDDGRGMDKDAILAKGKERGLVRDGDVLSERDIFNLIFAPGLSTAKKLTEVSGRGVGMDVVKKSIDQLRGQVEIRSQVGKGTIFTIKLPLTLAIIDGMVVRVGHERYIIPTLSVVRSLRPKPEQVSSVFDRGELLNLAEGLVPLVRLGRTFEVPEAISDPLRGLVVVIEDDGKPICLLVDELLGQQQIVIKNLGEALGRMPGISGSAIMADGRVGLIIDVGGLVRLAHDAEVPLAA
ncbi:MAG: chemotaxis protein CheA [Candidatus Eisenbacteria bacterium]|nr:chemotaxis protein CheA [Candidatus Eisenbacteria bacterium]